MVTKTITEQRAEVRIFSGNDPAHTATGSSGIPKELGYALQHQLRMVIKR